MYIRTNNGDAAPIHSSPDDFSPVLSNIPAGFKVLAVYHQGIWYKVSWKGKEGFVSAIYLTPSDPRRLINEFPASLT